MEYATKILSELLENEGFYKDLLDYKESLIPKIKFIKAKYKDTFPINQKNERTLIRELKANKLLPKYYRMIYNCFENHQDCFVCMVHNPKYTIGFSVDSGFESYIHLKLLYRHINKGEMANFKARQLLRKFERIAAKCGFEAIFLNAQPIRLSERLPFTEKSFACDETLDQKQLILWYKKQGYSLDGEDDDLMCKIIQNI
tara:strand:- start:89 stop:688 length:600 start_codon:yes stop_codon:yes gene_type:complete